MKLAPYLAFGGTGAEALIFYARALGGQTGALMRFARDARYLAGVTRDG